MPRSKKDPPLKILLFSENQVEGPVIRGYLKFFGHQVVHCTQLEEAHRRLRGEGWDVALWDHTGHPQGFASLIDHYLPPPLHVGVLPQREALTMESPAAWGYQAVLFSPIELESLEQQLKAWLATLGENFGLCLDAHGGDILDLDLIRSRYELDQELLPQLGEIYFRETPKTLLQLEAEVTLANQAGIEAWSHRLKGMAGNLGAKRISLLASEMEKQSRAHDLSQIPQLLQQIHLAVEETNRQYRELLQNPQAQLR